MKALDLTYAWRCRPLILWPVAPGDRQHIMMTWRHETLSVSLALCEGHPPVNGGFLLVMRTWVFPILFARKLFYKQSSCWWFGTIQTPIFFRVDLLAVVQSPTEPVKKPWDGVTKVPFVNFSVSKIFDLAKVPVRFLESHSCLTGVTAAELRGHLPNTMINVIFNN